MVGLTGRTATGKTTAAADGLVLGLRESYEQYYREQQKIRGRSYLADIMLSRGERIVHCGLRSPADYFRIKQAGGIVVALACPPEVCLSRIDTSNPKNPSSLEQYVVQQGLQDSPDDYGSHLMWAIDNADYIVDTSRTLEETFASLDSLVGRLLK